MANTTTRVSEFTFLEKSLAWSVQAFTASGAVAGFMAIVAISAHEWQEAMLWLLLSLIIDGIDGTFARLFRVKKVLPNFDGKAMDYVIDFANYAIIPTYFFYEAAMVDETWRMPCVVVMLIISAFYYGTPGMVTDDFHFVGFPVLWNLVVHYLFFVFAFSSAVNVALIFFFAILHFVPIKYLYPSRTSKLMWLNVINTVVCMVSNAAVIWLYPEVNFWWMALSIGSILYFILMGLHSTLTARD
ncbi:MAG: phosphatidylcholine/phosphatidylserine synthase [Chitinophagales bacterium]